MVSVDFKTKGIMEIPAERTFIHPLEATTNWAPTGPQFVLGERITTLEIQPTLGVVHGFTTPPDGSLLVLIWFNEREIMLFIGKPIGRSLMISGSTKRIDINN